MSCKGSKALQIFSLMTQQVKESEWVSESIDNEGCTKRVEDAVLVSGAVILNIT